MDNEKLKGETLSNLFKGERLKAIAKERGAVCPKCGKLLIQKIMPGYGEVYVHDEGDRRKCKCQYKNLDEIEEGKRISTDESKKKVKIEKKVEKREETIIDQELADEPEIVGVLSMSQYMEMEKNLLEKNIDKFSGKKDTHEASISVERHIDSGDSEIKTPVLISTEDTGSIIEGDQKVRENTVEETPLEEKVVKKMKEIDFKKVPVKEIDEEVSDEKRAVIIRKVIYKNGDVERSADKKEDIPIKEEDPFFDTHYGEETQLLVAADEKIICPTLTNTGTGEIVEIVQPIFRIGKRPEYEIRINENPAVSRCHAEILMKNDKCYIRDMDSKNGTFVNGLKIPPDTEMEIKDGQKIRFANEEYLFQMC